MNLAEIESILASEGLAPYNMDSRAMTEGQSARMGDSGEYDIADYMESDNSPEAQAIIDQLLDMGLEFLSDEFGAEEGCSGIDLDEAPARKPFGWLKRR